MLAAPLSIDLDDLWTYRRSFGYADWQEYQSFLHLAVPRFMALRSTLGLDATAFIVGHDASLERNGQLFRDLADSGIEIGNHSFWHEHGLQSRDRVAIATELTAAEDAILAATGRKPEGFRGPAFATSPALLHCLMERGYLYDASTFPTSIGPLARMYQQAKARQTSGREDDKQEELYGGFREASGSLKPFFWRSADRRLLEIPVTTMPFSRLPIHMTYIHFLADRSTMLARVYFKLAMGLCRRSGLSPSLLLHATDFMGCDDPPELHFIPGMARTARQKTELVQELLAHCQQSFCLTGLAAYARKQDPAVLAARPVGSRVGS